MKRYDIEVGEGGGEEWDEEFTEVDHVHRCACRAAPPICAPRGSPRRSARSFIHEATNFEFRARTCVEETAHVRRGEWQQPIDLRVAPM